MSQKRFVNIILVVVIVLLVGMVGYFAFVKKSEPVAQQPTPTQTNNPTKAPTPTTATSKDDTADWKTYTSTKYGFEFKYPSGHELYKNDVVNTAYKLEEHTIGFAIEDKRFEEMGYDDRISFAVKAGSGTPEEFLKNAFGSRYNEGISSGKLQKTTFVGRQAIIDNSNFLSGGYKTIYVYGKDDSYFILIEQGSSTNVLSQILSTFKFTR